MLSRELFGYCRNLQLLFCSISRPHQVSVDKNLLYRKLPYYLNIYLLESDLLYLAVKLFTILSKSNCVLHWNGTPICVFTNMNNSVQLKDRELRIFVLFLLIILKLCSLLTLKCAACVYFFRKLWVWEKIRSKFIKPWEMKSLPRDTRWNHDSCEVCYWGFLKHEVQMT